MESIDFGVIVVEKQERAFGLRLKWRSQHTPQPPVRLSIVFLSLVTNKTFNRIPSSLYTFSTAILHVRAPFTHWSCSRLTCCSEQPNPSTQSIVQEQWIRLVMEYARHRKLFILRIEDAETSGNDWDEVFRNERINRAVMSLCRVSRC